MLRSHGDHRGQIRRPSHPVPATGEAEAMEGEKGRDDQGDPLKWTETWAAAEFHQVGNGKVERRALLESTPSNNQTRKTEPIFSLPNPAVLVVISTANRPEGLMGVCLHTEVPHHLS